ncbi:MAG TPA: signal peptidase I [Chloroflexi bacterium]|nr:signal peptidase I [Chloroflexota bacterium]
MMGKRGWLAWAGVIAFLIALGVFFFPARLGGEMYYVILTGPSMEPHFHVGDLVLARRAPFYQPGDIAIYRHPRIGFVFHRIVGYDAEGRFRFKGDNNAWEDPYHPRPDEVLARYAARIPAVGKVLRHLRSPWVITALVVLIGLLLFGDWLRVGPDEEEENFVMPRGDTLYDWMIAFAVLLVLAVLLGVVAFTRPKVVQAQEPISYTETVAFSYTARAPEGLYDLPQVQPGEPIFTQLTGTITVGCTYRFTAAAPFQLEGTYRLLARVSDATGWKRTLPLTEPTAFQNGTFTAQATLHLEDMRRFIDEFEQITGRRGTYTLAVMAHIETHGTVGGEAFQETFEPMLRFRWNGNALVLETSGGVPLGEKAPDPLHIVRQNAIVHTVPRVNTLLILGAHVPVPLARTVSVVVGGLALVLLGGALYYEHQVVEGDPVAQIRLIGGVTTVPLDALPHHTLPVVEVGSLSDLASLAALHRAPVFHLREGEQVHFWLKTPDVVYHYGAEGQARVPQHARPLLPRPRFLRWKAAPVGGACESVLEEWAQTVDSQVVHDAGHSQRVARLAVALGKALGLSEPALRDLRLAALLHGLGLIEIPPEIVQKTAPLTEEEKRILREHVLRLNVRFESVEALAGALRIAYHRTERWDGSGYPDGLRGEQIPLGARILAVVDAWDALRHNRPHRAAWPESAAASFLRQKAGEWYDPRVVEVFLNWVKASSATGLEQPSSTAGAPAVEDEDDEATPAA